MGLTGAGGALVAIPLFINLLGLTLKEATVLSLLSVLLGTSINLFNQFSKVDKKVVLPLSISGIIANGATLNLKSFASDLLVAALIIGIALYSFWSIWSGIQSTKSIKVNSSVTRALATGALLGVLTTLTGLGGGVILIPLLIKVFGKSYKDALPTSLGAIFVISLVSFLFQAKVASELISLSQIILMICGTVIAFFVLKLMTGRLKDSTILVMRKIVFSLVTLYSISSVIIKVI